MKKYLLGLGAMLVGGDRQGGVKVGYNAGANFKWWVVIKKSRLVGVVE